MDSYCFYENEGIAGWIQIFHEPEKYGPVPMIAYCHHGKVGVQTYLSTDLHQITRFLQFANTMSRPPMYSSITVTPYETHRNDWWAHMIRFVVLFFENLKDNEMTEKIRKEMAATS